VDGVVATETLGFGEAGGGGDHSVGDIDEVKLIDESGDLLLDLLVLTRVVGSGSDWSEAPVFWVRA